MKTRSKIIIYGVIIASSIVAISTIVLVGVTGYYAKQTKNIVNVLEKIAELSIILNLKGTFQQIGSVAGFGNLMLTEHLLTFFYTITCFSH